MVHEMLSKALDADEKGDKDLAIQYYSNAVDMVLKLSDLALKEHLNKYAIQALERAEELRGISVRKMERKFEETNRPNVRINSKLNKLMKRCGFDEMIINKHI